MLYLLFFWPTSTVNFSTPLGKSWIRPWKEGGGRPHLVREVVGPTATLLYCALAMNLFTS